MPRISSPRLLDLTKPFVTSSQAYGSKPFDLSENLVTWYRDVQGDFVPDLSGKGNTARCAGINQHPRVLGSDDVPEFNPLNYKLQSLDFTLDSGPTGTIVDHLSSVNELGQQAALADHSFVNDGNDVPFSISFWLKLSSTTTSQYVMSKIILAHSYEWQVTIGYNTLIFYAYSQGSSSDYIQITKIITGTADQWHHFVITYDGSKTKEGLSMYVDGTSTGNRNEVGTYDGMSTTNAALSIGSVFASTTLNSLNVNDLIGKVHSFAIWKNRELEEHEVKALYYAYLNGPGGEARSGFISRSPRLHLRELDDLPGSYSTVRRTGDPTRTGALTSNFNDETTIIFSEDGNVVFPAMLPKGSSFMDQAVDIIGQESDISASLPIRSFQQPNHLHYSPTEAVGPFNESRSTPATDFFLTGTDPGIMPGFSEPARSKIKLTKEITNSSEFQLGIGAISRGNSDDRAGVAYLNFNESKLEYKGLQDPATGDTIPFDIASSLDQTNVGGKYYYSSTGSTSMVQLFVRPENQYDTPFYDDSGVASYVGFPTVAAFGPVATKYYAKSSQLLRMSDFIRGPFMLEKVSIEISDVEVQRPSSVTDAGLGWSFIAPGSSPPTLGIASKLQDNYVFFLGRQLTGKRDGLSSYNNAGLDDQIWEVSSSVREIIATASACFYNLPSYLTCSSMTGPIHSPAFAYNFDQAVWVPKIDIGIISNPGANFFALQFDSVGAINLFPPSYTIGATGNDTIVSLYGAITSSTAAMATLDAAGYSISLVGFQIILVGSNPFSPVVSNTGMSTGFMAVASPAYGGAAKTYSGPMRIDFHPTTSPLLPNMGLRSIPNETVIAKSASALSLSTNKVTLQLDSWPGGSSIQEVPFNTSNYITTSSNFNYTIMAEFPTGTLASRTSGSFFSSTTTIDSPLLLNETAIKNFPSTRAFRKFGGENAGIFSLSNSSSADPIFSYRGSAEPSSISPYILMPEDEIFVGVDAGISVHYGMNSFSRFDDTFMKFPEGSVIKISLFGSEIKNGVSHVNSLNQDLSSNSIHEIVGAEPQLDQFQIEPITSYYGSHLDEIVTGSMVTPLFGGAAFITSDQDSSRKIVGRVSLGQAGSTGSLQRFVKISDSNERTYDSCLPSYADFFKNETSFKVEVVNNILGVSSRNHELITWLPDVGVEEAFEIDSFLKNQFPFQDNPKRQLLNAGTFATGSTPAGGLFVSDIEQFRNEQTSFLDYGNYTNFRAVDWAYRVGYSFTNTYNLGSDFTYVAAHRTKAAVATTGNYPNYSLNLGTARYGISNTRPEFTSSRWRYDHYGHLRDMLEPRLLTARFDGFTPVKVRFMSGSSVLTDPTDTHSQNISSFATSSLPYFDDGVARNRSDNPDESLVNVLDIVI